MQKSYLLLRHNQQSGPYSLNELEGLSLRPQDLIWVIGQSAGWRYPEEIEALKTLLPGSAVPVPATTPQSASTTLDDQAKPVIYSTPHIYVSLPPIAPGTTQLLSTEAAPSSSFEERVEKMRQRAAAIEEPVTTDQSLEVETKYSRSLDDIKAEYASWMRTQKRKRNGKLKGKPVILTAAIVVMALGIWWVVSSLFSPASKQVFVNNTGEVAAEKAFYPTVVLPPAPVSGRLVTSQEKEVTARKVNKQPEKTTVIPKADTPVLDTQTAQSANTQKKEVLAETDVIDAVTNEDSVEAAATKPATVAEQLLINAEYIAGTKKSMGVEGLAVTVKNNSSQLMKVVAVDVIYFIEGMEELERKTLYFSNLQPGQVLTRHAPAHKKAEGAYAQLGLISSEEGSIFYASNK